MLIFSKQYIPPPFSLASLPIISIFFKWISSHYSFKYIPAPSLLDLFLNIFELIKNIFVDSWRYMPAPYFVQVLSDMVIFTN